MFQLHKQAGRLDHGRSSPMANDLRIGFLMLVVASVVFMAWFLAVLVRERTTRATHGRMHLVVKLKSVELAGEPSESTEAKVQGTSARPAHRVGTVGKAFRDTAEYDDRPFDSGLRGGHHDAGHLLDCGHGCVFRFVNCLRAFL